MGYTSGTKWNIDLVRDLIESKGYILVSTKYENALKEITFADIDGYYYYQCISVFMRNKQRKFYKSNPYTIQNIKLWCKLKDKPFILLSNEYVDAKVKLQWQCLKDGCEEIFYATWSDIFSGNGCGYCHGTQVGLSNCLFTKNTELASEWHPTLNGKLTPHDVTLNSNIYVWWQCKDNPKHEWYAIICSRNSGRCCPECNQSKGEKECKRVFELTNVYYIPQKEFDGLLGLGYGKLSYDFYLPEYNLLVEYQGLQHEKYCKGFHKSKKEFEKQQEHDRRKKEYAKNNDIRLLEIWYWDFDNVDEILSKFLNNTSKNNL